MKSIFYRAAAIALAAVLSLPPAVIAAPRDRDDDRTAGQRIVRIIKKIQKIFRLTPNDDALTPPISKP